jgi:hypothetical protein
MKLPSARRNSPYRDIFGKPLPRMTHLKLTLLFAILALAAIRPVALAGKGDSTESGNSPIWPMPDRTDLSSGFGDYRPGRFHYGLDLRTGDNRLPVVAPVDGYIEQVWVQYFGFGKALYLSGDDGRTYVFAHLARYAPKLNQRVREIQVRKERYFIHEWFTADSYRVRQGDTIAYSGKTGIGAPHMHFEVRNSSHVPQSPLRQGLKINDKTGPVIKSLTFRYLDYETRFSTGGRAKKLNCLPIGLDGEGASRYNLPTFPYLTAPFGLIVSATDYPTNNKFNSSPRVLRYRVGKSPLTDTIPDANLILYRTLYDELLDSLSYGQGAKALDVYDVTRAIEGDKTSFLLYQRKPNPIDSTQTDSIVDIRPGRFPEYLTRPSKKLYGIYPARIDITDASGNRSTLDYSFCYGPPGELFKVTDIGPDFALLTTDHLKLLQKKLFFSKLQVYELNKEGGWSHAEKATVKHVGKGAFRVTIERHMHNRKRVYRAVLKGYDGWHKPDVIFSNVPSDAKTKVALSYQLADGGVYVTATTGSPTTEKPTLQALTADSSFRELAVNQIGSRTFNAYVPYNKKLETIEAFRAFIGDRAGETAAEILNIQIGVPISVELAGSQSHKIVSNGTCYVPIVDSRFERLLEWGAYRKHVPQAEALVAGPFYLGPTNFRYQPKVTIRMKADTAFKLALQPELRPALNIAICKLSKKGDKWDWHTTDYGDELVAAPFSAEITSNGVFALLIDTVAPEITRIRPRKGQIVTSSLPKITANVEDALSGIWTDTLFNIRLDGEWLIPEYDNEDNVLETQPNHPLKSGEHSLVIRVRDNAGNLTQRKTTFHVQ